jgi:hypothetical protein
LARGKKQVCSLSWKKYSKMVAILVIFIFPEISESFQQAVLA